MSVLAVTDAHALLWYAEKKWKKLGREALRAYQRVSDGDGAIFVPAMVMAELSEAMHDGDWAAPGGFAYWGDRLFSSGRFFPADLTWPIVKRAEELFAIPERGDRLIAATALEYGYPLITRDPEIAAAAGVEIIW